LTPSRALSSALATLLLAGGCAQRGAPPSPDQPQAAVPSLAGATVMVLPAQVRAVAPDLAALDEEIGYWLSERGRRVRWVLPPAIDRALARNPMLEIRPRALAVDAFGAVEVRNIGDPLFGDLRRLGALVDARLALVPTHAAYVPLADGTGRVEIAAALIDTVGGRVLWYGVVAGSRGPPGERATLATAAEALAQAVIR
jgi:hypothetical protein